MSNYQSSQTSSSSSSLFGVLWFSIAAFCSWMINHSIGWAIWHGIWGPFYILYLCGGCGGGFKEAEVGLRHCIKDHQCMSEFVPFDNRQPIVITDGELVLEQE